MCYWEQNTQTSVNKNTSKTKPVYLETLVVCERISFYIQLIEYKTREQTQGVFRAKWETLWY